MTKRRLIGGALAGAAMSLTMVSTPAAAQRVERIVAFGDSYADDGNLFQLLGVNPVSTIIYPTGRFTGGTNYVDTLGTIYNLTPNNFAIGGALTDNTNTTLGAPGFTFERLSFLAGGGGVFPTTSPTLGSGDLVTVSIGGNDARVYANSGTVAGAPAAAAVAVTNATTNLNAIIGSGTPTISFIAGNTALLPEVAGNAPVQAVRAAYSNAFNQGMQATLAGYAANGAIVHYLDLTTMLAQVQANPGAYGFTNLGPCTPIATCVADSNFADQFVFWVDALHPTSRTSAVIAKYIAAQLQAPLTFAAPSELGLETARQFGRTLAGRADIAAVRDGSAEKGLTFFVSGNFLSRDVDPDSTTDSFEIRSYGATAGAQFGFDRGVVGIAGNYSRPKADFGNGASQTRDHTWQVGGYAAVVSGALFGQAYAGYGHDDHRIGRAGVVTPMEASPNGSHWLAGAKAGYLMPLAGLRVGPVVGVDYAKAKVSGYTETGDPTLTLNVSSVSAKSLEGSAGLEVRGKFGVHEASIRPFASALLVKDFEGDGRLVQFSQTTAPAIVNSWQLEDRSRHVYGRLTAGGSARLLGVDLEAVVSTTVDRRDGDDTSVNVGLKVGF